MSATILVVDDSPTTRRMVRVALTAEGYGVSEAADGWTAIDLATEHPPDLILMDLLLPDFDAFDLFRQLRSLPSCATVPVLAFSGWFSKMDEARRQRIDFADYLVKPVELVRLLNVVKLHLAAGSPQPSPTLTQVRVLVVDDDPIQLRSIESTLQRHGCDVVATAESAAALDFVRRSPPRLVVADVLLPRLDGFRLALTIRRDPRLADVAIVLTSAAPVDSIDRQRARAIGASAFVQRTADKREILQAIGEALRAEAPVPVLDEVPADFVERIILHLERQTPT